MTFQLNKVTARQPLFIQNRVLLTVGSLCQGTIPMSLTQLGQAFLHQGDPLYQTVIWELRLPRILAALVVGAALGMSGALLQGMLRNG